MSEAEGQDLCEAAEPLVRALLEESAAQLGPAIGVELEVGEPEIEAETEMPEGELAVIGIAVERDGETFAHVEIVSALEEIVAFSRRMSGVEEPDAKEGIDDDDLDPIGELLKLLAGGVEDSARAQLEGELTFAAGEWWRADEPGENAFAAGPCYVGAAPFTVPGGPTANLFFRMGAGLFSSGDAEGAAEVPRTILLLDLGEELGESLTSALSSSGVPIEAVSREDEKIHEAYANAEAIFLSSDEEFVFELCRELRVASETWRVPLILCASEPTEDLVMRAINDGVSQVLCVPAERATIVRTLKAARPAQS